MPPSRGLVSPLQDPLKVQKTSRRGRFQTCRTTPHPHERHEAEEWARGPHTCARTIVSHPDSRACSPLTASLAQKRRKSVPAGPCLRLCGGSVREGGAQHQPCPLAEPGCATHARTSGCKGIFQTAPSASAIRTEASLLCGIVRRRRADGERKHQSLQTRFSRRRFARLSTFWEDITLQVSSSEVTILLQCYPDGVYM